MNNGLIHLGLIHFFDQECTPTNEFVKLDRVFAKMKV